MVHVGQNWGSYTLLTELPTYMKNILHFDIANVRRVSGSGVGVVKIIAFSYLAVY